MLIVLSIFVCFVVCLDGQTGSGKTYTMDGIQYISKTADNEKLVDEDSAVTDHADTDKTEEHKTPDPTDSTSSSTKPIRILREPTMIDSGISIRCINQLFDFIASDSHTHYTVKCSFIQIYQEQVYDLLAETQPTRTYGSHTAASANSLPVGLRIRWTPKTEFYVENLYTFECKTAKEAR